MITTACLSMALAAPAAADTSGSGTGHGPNPPSPTQTDMTHPQHPAGHDPHPPVHDPGPTGQKSNPDLDKCLSGKGEGLAGFIAAILPGPFKGLCQHFTNFALTDHFKHSIGLGETPKGSAGGKP